MIKACHLEWTCPSISWTRTKKARFRKEIDNSKSRFYDETQK
jgi:hypothetical protein